MFKCDRIAPHHKIKTEVVTLPTDDRFSNVIIV